MCKKIFVVVLIAIIFFSPTTINAVGYDEDSDSYYELFEQSRAMELYEYLSPQSKEMLEDMGIEDMDYNSIINLNFSQVLDGIKENFSLEFFLPLQMLFNVLVIILVSGVLSSLQAKKNALATTHAFNMVSVLCLSAVVVPNMVGIIEHTRTVSAQISEFIAAFVPIFAGIISVSGKPVSAFTYSGVLLATTQFMSVFINYAIFPMIGIYFAFSIVSYASGIGNLLEISKSVKAVMLWTLGLILTVFVGMLTIRSFVSSSADSVTMRAGKYVVGSFVPIVGGAISESIGILQSSLSLIKSTVGAFGIIALIITIIPVMLNILSITLVLKLAKILSDIFSEKLVSDFLSSADFVLSMLASIVICYSLMLIISISLILALGVGT